jgi:hypothetical protein
MSPRRLHHMLEGLVDGCELVLAGHGPDDPLERAWRDAEQEAGAAYHAWAASHAADDFAVYRACAGRADAAQDALAAARSRT